MSLFTLWRAFAVQHHDWASAGAMTLHQFSYAGLASGMPAQLH
jgi:hypothetical protein